MNEREPTRVAGYAEGPLETLLWRTVLVCGSTVGVRPARWAASVALRLGARLSAHSYQKTARRVSRRLQHANPELVKIPAQWSAVAPVVRARRRGVVLDLDLRDNLQALLFYTGTYEPALSRFLAQELRHGDVLLDVGAHIGVHALAAARRLQTHGGGRVLAFEPTPDSAAKLRTGAGRNGLDITVVESALGDAPGEMALFADDRYDPADAGVRSAFGTGPLVAVTPVTTFDEWAAANHLTQLDIVKIDVEGCEAAVLRGMRESLQQRQPRALLVEIKQNSIGRAPTSDQQLRALLSDLGYETTGRVFDHNELFRPEKAFRTGVSGAAYGLRGSSKPHGPPGPAWAALQPSSPRRPARCPSAVPYPESGGRYQIITPAFEGAGHNEAIRAYSWHNFH